MNSLLSHVRSASPSGPRFDRATWESKTAGGDRTQQWVDEEIAKSLAKPVIGLLADGVLDDLP